MAEMEARCLGERPHFLFHQVGQHVVVVDRLRLLFPLRVLRTDDDAAEAEAEEKGQPAQMRRAGRTTAPP